MALVRDRCVAVHNLLLSVQGTPVHLDIARTQHSQLLTAIRAATLTATELADMVTHLNAIVWPQQNMSDELLLAANSASARGRPMVRSANQDYTAVVNYYTQQDWADTANNTTQNLLHTLLAKPLALGLKNPTENTFQVLAALLLVLQEGACEKANMLSPQMKFESLKFVKKRFRAAATYAPNVPWIQILPANPDNARDIVEFTPVFDNVYFEGDPIASPFNASLFNSVATSIPMRCTNARVRSFTQSSSQAIVPSHSPFDGQGMMQAMMQMMRMMQGSGSGSGADDPRIKIKPGLKRLQTFTDEPDGEQDEQAVAIKGQQEQQATAGQQEQQAVAIKLQTMSPTERATKAQGKRKLTVEEATASILTDLGIGARGSDAEDDSDDDDDEGGAVKKSKKAKSKANAKARAKSAVAKAKAKATAKKAPLVKAKAKAPAKKDVSATIANEASRKQFRCRAADGSSFSISYKKAGGEAKALAEAKKWLSKQ